MPPLTSRTSAASALYFEMQSIYAKEALIVKGRLSGLSTSTVLVITPPLKWGTLRRGGSVADRPTSSVSMANSRC